MNNGYPPISNAERRSLPFLLTFFVKKTPLSPDPTITENPRITEGLASPQAYYLPSITDGGRRKTKKARNHQWAGARVN